METSQGHSLTPDHHISISTCANRDMAHIGFREPIEE